MKVAICFSGNLRSFNLVKSNIKNTINAWNSTYDIFAYVPLDDNNEKNYILDVFPEAEIKIAKDEYIDDSAIPNYNRFKTGKQKYLQQIYGWYNVNKMRIKKEEENKFKYDFVVRCRPDILFVNSIPNIQDLNQNILYIPKFHDWDGYNDRFCIGDSEIINNYMNIFEEYKKYPNECIHAETFLKYCLDKNNVKVKLIDTIFNRVSQTGEMIDDFK